MAFTNNRLDFYNLKSYDEKTHAAALGKGIPSFVVKGLELNGTILNSGIFTNTGTFGQLGNEGETHTIATNYTGYVVIKSTLNGNGSTSVVELSTTRKDTDQRDTSNIKYFTIYQLDNGEIVNDFRHINFVKSFEVINKGGGNFTFKLNGFESDSVFIPGTNATSPIGGATAKDLFSTLPQNYSDVNIFIGDVIDKFITKYSDEDHNINAKLQVDNTFFPGLVEAIKSKITENGNFEEPTSTRFDIHIETLLNAGSLRTSKNTSSRVTFFETLTTKSWSCIYDLDTFGGINVDTFKNEKGEYGDVYSNKEEKILGVDFVGLFMTSGQSLTSTITLPNNFKVTEVRYIWSQFDDTTNEALLTGTTTQLVGGGKIFDGVNGLFYDIHTSGGYDPLMLTMSSNGADPTLPDNIKSCSLIRHKIDYTTKKLTVEGGRYADSNNYYRKLVLNTIMIVGEYVNYQPTALAKMMKINDIDIDEAIAQLLEIGFTSEELEIERGVIENGN